MGCQKPYHLYMEDPYRNEPIRMVFGVTTSDDKNVEIIVDTMIVIQRYSNLSYKYLVR